jgi:hypothetical protein
MTSGITHTAGTSQITVAQAGIYMIDYTVTSNQGRQVAVFDNGSLITGTIFGTQSANNAAVGQAIVSLAAGDVLTLVNNVANPSFTLNQNSGGTATGADASIVIVKLS